VADHNGLVPSDFEFTIAWQTPLLPAIAAQPTTGPKIENPGWMYQQRRPLEKHTEVGQDFVDPDRWYHRGKSFVRIETRSDGVARIEASDVIALADFGALDSIGLFWRGQQQPIFIDDVDSSRTFSSGDVIYFLGRRASGDTTFLDENDSMGVFYLTGTMGNERPLRYQATVEETSVDTTYEYLIVDQRVEVDTGYFHPGNGVDDDSGYLYTPRANHEGFYWTTLNARGQQSSQYRLPFIPDSSSRIAVSVEVVTTTDSKAYNPDHAIDVIFANGQPAMRMEVDGVGRHIIRDTLNSSAIPPVHWAGYVQATGFPDRMQSNDWSSQVLVDAFSIRGNGATILQKGRMIGSVEVQSPAALRLRNAPSSHIVVLDSTQSIILRPFSFVRTTTLRAGAWPYRDANTPDSVRNDRFCLAVAVDDSIAYHDDIRRFAIVSQVDTTGRLKCTVYNDEQSLVEGLRNIDSARLCVVVNMTSSTGAGVVDELQRRGLDVTASEFTGGWIASFINGRSKITDARHHVSSYDNQRSSYWTSNVAVPRGAHAMFIGSGEGIERARVLAARNSFLSRKEWTNGVDVIAIAHREHWQEALRWLEHRSRFSNIAIELVDVEDVLEAYGAGRHDPRALRSFLKHVWSKSLNRRPTHCVLIGNASWDVRNSVKNGNVDARRPDQIPTYGRPSTDMWFGLLDDEYDLVTPEIIVSRFPSVTAEETRNLVDKIISYDTVPVAAYHRRFLYAGGGEDGESFCDIYNRILRDDFGLGVSFTSPPLCLDTVTVCKQVDAQPGRLMRSYINQGVAWINFIGHGGTELFDIDDWKPSQLANEGRYPILATYSCLTGAYSSPSGTCENAKYLFEPRKGAVAAIGSTGYQYVGTADLMHYRIHEVLLNTSYRSVGDLTYEAKSAFAKMNSTYGRNAAMQFCLLGDPFTRLRIDSRAELAVTQGDVRFTTMRDAEPVVDDDSLVTVNVEVWNRGLSTKQPCNVTLVRTFGSRNDTLTARLNEGFCRRETLTFALSIAGMAGTHTFTITVDPTGVIGDDRTDNVVTRQLEVRKRSLIILEPSAYKVLSRDSARIRIIDVVSDTFLTATIPIQVAICRDRDTASLVLRSTADQLTRVAPDAPMLVDWFVPKLNTVDTGSVYWVAAWPDNSVMKTPAEIAWMPVSFSSRVISSEHHQVASNALTDAEGFIFDSASSLLFLSSLRVPMTVRSAGRPTQDPVRDPYMSIRMRDSVILENSFRQGLNLVVFSSFDTLPRVIRRYDTSPNASPVETGHDGYARECLQFLRDSISNGEVLALVACDESFSRFIRDALLIDLRSELVRFGARYSDSLNASVSYVLIGTKGDSLAHCEAVSGDGAPVSASASVPFSRPQATFPLPKISARSWSGIDITSTGAVFLNIERVSGTGIIDTLRVSNSWRSSESYTYTPLALTLQATVEEPRPRLGAINLFYEPRPQCIGIPAQGWTETILRGDTAVVRARVFNARLSYDAVSTPLRLELRDDDGNIQYATDDVITVAASEIGEVTYRIPTTNLPVRSELLTIVDPVSALPMQHRVFWQNRRTVQTREDTEKPAVVLLADGIECVDGSYVQSAPLFTVLLTDRSNLEIDDPEYFTVFVNGIRVRSDNVEDWRFFGSREVTTVSSAPLARAALQYRFPMEVGENLIIVRAKDANGNADTAEISVFRAPAPTLQNVVITPNPASGYVIGYRYDLGLDTPEAQMHVSLYDVQGRLFRSYTNVATTGRGQGTVMLNEGTYTPVAGFYRAVFELVDNAGKTLSTVTKNIILMP
jgi:hypothetical protein